MQEHGGGGGDAVGSPFESLEPRAKRPDLVVGHRQDIARADEEAHLAKPPTVPLFEQDRGAEEEPVVLHEEAGALPIAERVFNGNRMEAEPLGQQLGHRVVVMDAKVGPHDLVARVANGLHGRGGVEAPACCAIASLKAGQHVGGRRGFGVVRGRLGAHGPMLSLGASQCNKLVSNGRFA